MKERLAPEEMTCLAGLFDGLTEADLNEVLQAAHRRDVPRGESIFSQEDPAAAVYVIVQGQAKLLRVTPEGNQVNLGFAGPGDMVGGLGALKDGAYSVSAEATCPCVVLGWSGKAMVQLISRYPGIAVNALGLLADQLQGLEDRYVELATERVERRVARALLQLVRHAGRKVDGGILIDLRLSRQDLAEMTGTTLYTISRILSRWEQKQLVECGRERVVIKYPHGLVRVAEDWPERNAKCEVEANVRPL